MPPLIVANASAFFGDRHSAPREMISGGRIDVLTGDYLAELTMALLHRQRMKGRPGYVPTFLTQLREIYAECLERKIKIVTNAGGLDPRGLAEAVTALGGRVAYVEGDDVREKFPDALTANVYLGAWGIREALERGADVVITGRVTDAALVIGPAAWRFGWSREHYDRLAGALIAGHVLECGAQATGGNYAFFEEVKTFRNIGFPIAELHEDGSFVVTKHPGTGGLVSVGTVTAQLLYEIPGARYPSPDVVARFDSIRLTQQGDDRVLVDGARGEPPPETAKVCVNTLGGFRNEMRMLVPTPRVEEKIAVLREMIAERVQANVQLEVQRTDREDPETNAAALAMLRVIAVGDAEHVGRAFSSAVVELATASIPGIALATPPGDAIAFAVLRSPTMPWADVHERLSVDGKTVTIPSPKGSPLVRDEHVDVDGRAPFPKGDRFGARSGDKGGDATLGVWARDPADFPFLRDHLGVARLRELLPELAPLKVERYPLPNLHAILFVVRGLLGDGVSSSTRIDPQAKSLGEWLRTRMISAAGRPPIATT